MTARADGTTPIGGRIDVFDALPDAAAIVGADGTVTHVNRAWVTFAALNGGEPGRTGVGINYLDLCLAGGHPGDDASCVAAGLSGVLAGRLRSFEHRYPCPSPIEDRWFVARITPVAGDALVCHLDVTVSKLAEDRLAYRASHDTLTGLPNRDAVVDHLRIALARLARTGAPVAVLFLDLDGFKAVNDRYGHAAGDRVLVQVANRLRRQVRASDIVGRIGGDEFVVVCEADLVEPLVGRLRHAVCSPIQLGSDTVRIGVSIGVAVADSPGEVVLDRLVLELLSQADASMYAEKARFAGMTVADRPVRA